MQSGARRSLVIACLLVVPLGCSPAVDFEGSFGDVPSDGGTGNDGGGDGTGASSGGGDESGSDSGGVKYDVGAGPGGGVPGGGNCSPDLQAVLDPDTGEVVEECPPDQGCYDGDCIPACEAAGLSAGSVGCDYVAPTIPFYHNDLPASDMFHGPCHALMIANTWGRPALLSLERGETSYDAHAHTRIPKGVGPATIFEPVPASGIPVGQVAILFLNHKPGVQHDIGGSLECPVPPVFVGDPAGHGTDSGVSFELLSDTPITVYDILPYGGANSYLPSASLIFPTTAWGEDYVVTTPHLGKALSIAHREWTLVVAEEDGTSVTFRTQVPVVGGTIANPPPGVPTQYTLARGEFLQWTSLEDMAGTVVTADRRVGVYSGNTYLEVRTADSAGGPRDASHQQLVHLNGLASEYVAAGIPTRLASGDSESVLYRVLGVVDGTTLVYDPVTPSGAPTTLGFGQVVEFESRDQFVISAQDEDHPFSFAHYMSGGISEADAAGGCFPSDGFGDACILGDTDWVVPVPPAQFLSHYAFFVDPTYGVTSLTVVRTRGPGGFVDVHLDCMASPVTGWQPLGGSGQYEVAHVDLHRKGVGACATSQQLATSSAPFGLTVWGSDHCSSYGYPAGGNARVINDVYVPAG